MRSDSHTQNPCNPRRRSPVADWFKSRNPKPMTDSLELRGPAARGSCVYRSLEVPWSVAEEYLDRPDMIPPLSSELFRLGYGLRVVKGWGCDREEVGIRLRSCNLQHGCFARSRFHIFSNQGRQPMSNLFEANLKLWIE